MDVYMGHITANSEIWTFNSNRAITLIFIMIWRFRKYRSAFLVQFFPFQILEFHTHNKHKILKMRSEKVYIVWTPRDNGAYVPSSQFYPWWALHTLKLEIMVVGIGSKNAPCISTTQNKASILFLTFHFVKKLWRTGINSLLARVPSCLRLVVTVGSGCESHFDVRGSCLPAWQLEFGQKLRSRYLKIHQYLQDNFELMITQLIFFGLLDCDPFVEEGGGESGRASFSNEQFWRRFPGDCTPRFSCFSISGRVKQSNTLQN